MSDANAVRLILLGKEVCPRCKDEVTKGEVKEPFVPDCFDLVCLKCQDEFLGGYLLYLSTHSDLPSYARPRYIPPDYIPGSRDQLLKEKQNLSEEYYD